MEKEDRRTLPVEEQRLKEYCVALEHTRADLMGVNEELRSKILALEKGQEDLIAQLEAMNEALGWKKINRSEYPKNYEIMKYSQGFMEELYAMTKEQLDVEREYGEKLRDEMEMTIRTLELESITPKRKATKRLEKALALPRPGDQV